MVVLTRLLLCLGILLHLGSPPLGARARYPGNDPSNKGILQEGDYTAPIQGLICDACLKIIRTALLKVDGIHTAKVVLEKKTLFFTVKKRQTAKISHIKNALRDAEKKMGIGVHYKLGKIRAVP